jgi:hypothetical protein
MEYCPVCNKHMRYSGYTGKNGRVYMCSEHEIFSEKNLEEGLYCAGCGMLISEEETTGEQSLCGECNDQLLHQLLYE